MTTFPTHVTHAQMRAAAEALGLPAEIVTDVHLSATDGVSVTVQILDRQGRLLVQGDGPLTANIHLPYDYTEARSAGGWDGQAAPTVDTAAGRDEQAPDDEPGLALLFGQHPRILSDIPPARVFNILTGVELDPDSAEFRRAVGVFVRSLRRDVRQPEAQR